MDPLTHTLFGAALAQAGLGRVARGATVALLVGANLPDVDALAYFWDGDVGLQLRRGWSHGVLAMLVLPLLLTASLLLWQRWRRCSAGTGEGPRSRPGALLAIACLAVWSHPLLDWMNTYGIRLLMPFDGRWFYGDALFIVDPWLWLLLASGVVLAQSSHWLARLGWAALAAIASWLVLSRGLPQGVVLGWGLGLMAMLLLCRFAPASAAPRVARAGLLVAVAYAGLMFGLARQAEARALARFPAASLAQASPLAGVPFAYRVVLAEPGAYRIIGPDRTVQVLARTPADATVRRALADPSIRGFAGWTRLPWWQVEHHGDASIVRFHDLRYSVPGQRGGIGYAEVVVPRAGVPAAGG